MLAHTFHLRPKNTTLMSMIDMQLYQHQRTTFIRNLPLIYVLSTNINYAIAAAQIIIAVVVLLKVRIGIVISAIIYLMIAVFYIPNLRTQKEVLGIRLLIFNFITALGLILYGLELRENAKTKKE